MKQFYCQEFDTGSTLENLPVYMVLSRIFCWGGGGGGGREGNWIMKKFLTHTAVRKNCFRPYFENIVFKIG